jgi:immunity protein, SdpI family
VKNQTAERLARALIAAMFAAAIWTWPSAPAQIPIHWDITGQVNGYGSKFTALMLMPIVGLAGYVVIGLTAIIRPEQFEGRVMNALSWFRLAYVVVMAGVFGVIVGDARGSNLNMNCVVVPVLALMMAASANLVVQLSRLKSTKTAPPGGGIEV